ncbi:PTS sugar transporter subunit IIA [Propioniciclava coleopterorum]|uniref:PTS sugar transporter subunit IIA n=1 Tax=Propioniciclava coleopterorum TaxID=2714937 RepID=A0A6G7YA85_9ACTN|nr:PTS sugar transporter subunit IIA [Propioniciclava coleopterorum]QIK73680.1 PTS sugar transporter subunit IIA [Propioniciclava coleopterorum]
MSVLISTEFTHVNLWAPDQAVLFDAMADALVAGGRVRPTFREAISQRERTFPTGLPVGCGVAIPHTDAVHVVADTISVATLGRPVRFGEMAGHEDAHVDVRVVVMLALSGGNQLGVLKRVIKAIQDDAFLDALLGASDRETLVALTQEAFLPQ